MEVIKKDLMSILHLKNVTMSGRYDLSGMVITFKSNVILKSNYLYINYKGINKYFSVTEVASDHKDTDLLYQAIECGYGQDKLSKITDLDIREILNQSLIELTCKEEIQSLNQRSCYT